MNRMRLTQFSHGSGCGCKIAPNVLREILEKTGRNKPDPRLLVGNDSFDDAAVISINDDMAIISTTDFFTPIVDDPKDFGAIAAVNSLSDVYAMGGEPLMAISILGWPVDKLSTDMAAKVVTGAKEICEQAGITLAGGHSIDTPEPIFGLAVTGKVAKKAIKRNRGAKPGDDLFLTKPIGIGILTTAQKMGALTAADRKKATALMLALNEIGAVFGGLDAVTAMTDVTGFGLLGHLNEMCEAGNVSAEIEFEKVPKLKNLDKYIKQKCVPGGTYRNYSSYGDKVCGVTRENKIILCDPQTSGGLLVAVNPTFKKAFLTLLHKYNLSSEPFGKIVKKKEFSILVK